MASTEGELPVKEYLALVHRVTRWCKAFAQKHGLNGGPLVSGNEGCNAVEVHHITRPSIVGACDAEYPRFGFKLWVAHDGAITWRISQTGKPDMVSDGEDFYELRSFLLAEEWRTFCLRELTR